MASHHHACSNCWFNGLQSDSMGRQVGFCVEHRVVLAQPDATTCGRQVRKDLMYDAAQAASRAHGERYADADHVVLLATGEPASEPGYVDPDSTTIRQDRLGEVIADYGEFGTKIESLAQLRGQGSVGAELAMLSLGRGYVRRCRLRDGGWTSGLHLLWWTKLQMERDPMPKVVYSDLRRTSACGVEKQLDLAAWWLMMSRLLFIADVATHARGSGDPVERLADLPNLAASESEVPTARRLKRWVVGRGLSLIDAALPRARYIDLAAELRAS